MGKSQTIGAQMRTSIALDTVGASNSVKSLTQAVNSATSAWKSQESMLKSTGDYLQASQAKYEGLGRAMEAQSSKIDAIKNKQKGLNVETQEGASQYLKYQTQVEKAETKLNSLTAQQARAKSSVDLEKSGIIGLNSAINLNEKATTALSNKLEAQGNHYEALKAKQSGLQSSMAKQNELLEKEQAQLAKIASKSGTAGDSYTKQKIKVDELSASLARNKTEATNLWSTMEKEAPTSWVGSMKNKLLGLDKQTESTAGKFTVMKGAMSSAIGNTISSGISMVTSSLGGLVGEAITASDSVDKFKSTMKLGGFGKKEINDTTAEVKKYANETVYDLGTVGNTTAQLAANGVKGYMKLTEAAGNLNAQAGGNADTFKSVAMMMTQTAGAGKLTTENWNQLADAIPGASGKLQEAMKKNGAFTGNFRDAMEAGQISSDEFNKALTQLGMNDGAKKASKSTSTFEGAMGNMQATVIDGMDKMIDKIGKKQMTDDINSATKAVTGLSKQAITLFDFMAKHADTVKLVGEVLVGTYASKKVLSGMASMVSMGKKMVFSPKINAETGKHELTLFAKALKGSAKGIGKALKFSAKIAVKAGQVALQGLTKTIGLVSKGFKALKMVMVANPFIAVTVAITAIVVALVALYKHNAKFRKFVNGLAKDAKKGIDKVVKLFQGMGKSIGKAFDAVGKTFSKGWSSIEKTASKGASSVNKEWDKVKTGASKATSTAMNTAKKTFSNGWNTLKTTTSRGSNDVSKAWNTLSNGTKKIAQSMMKSHEGTFKSGYKVMADRSNTWKDLTNGHFDRLGGDTKRTVQDMTKFWKNLFSDSYNYLNKITGGRLVDMFNTIKSIGDSISKAWSNMWNGMKKVFSDIWSGIKGLAKDGMQGVVGFINGGISGIDKVIDFFGGKKQAISPIKLATGTKDGRLTQDTLAILNDGNDSPETGNKEMVEKKDGRRYLVQGKDKLAYLEAGDAVYNATQTKQLMMDSLPHFGLGSWISDTASSVGSYVSDAVGNVSSWIGDKVSAIEKFAKDPVNEVLKVFDKSTSLKGASQLVSDMGPSGGHYLVRSGKDWFKKLFDSLKGSLENPGGAGVDRWKSIIESVANKMNINLTSAGMSAVLKRIAQESNGSATVTNNWDSNAKAGHPSTGLLQYIQPTFDHWLPRGFTNDIHNGSSQIAAMFNDSNWLRDISVSGGWGPTGHKQMANGGFVSTNQMIEVAEGNQKEAIIPMSTMKRSRAWSLLSDVVSQFASEDNNSGSNAGQTTVKDSEELKNLNNKFDDLLGKFNQLLSIQLDQTSTIANSAMDKKQLYKQQAKDLSVLTSQQY